MHSAKTFLSPFITLSTAALLLVFAGCELGDSGDEFALQFDEIQAPVPVDEPGESPPAAPPSSPAAPSAPAPGQVRATPNNIPSGIGSPGIVGSFVWKPISENDGRLVVLLPRAYTGRVTMAYIVREDGSFVESGRFSGDTHNGNRAHYRFSRPGADYGNRLFLVAVMNDGEVVHWFIPEGARRVG